MTLKELTIKKLDVPGPKARRILARDAATISPSYPRDYAFVMDHGRGCEAWDVDGNRFLDFAAGIAVCSTGHSHAAVVKAIQQQAEKFIHISSDFYHEKWVQLGEKLDEIAPFKEDALCFMANSGAEADLWRAQELMLGAGQEALPVMDGEHLHGVLTAADIRAAFYAPPPPFGGGAPQLISPNRTSL